MHSDNLLHSPLPNYCPSLAIPHGAGNERNTCLPNTVLLKIPQKVGAQKCKMVAKVYKYRYNYRHKITSTKVHSSSLPVVVLDVGLTLQGAISRYKTLQLKDNTIQYTIIQHSTQGAQSWAKTRFLSLLSWTLIFLLLSVSSTVASAADNLPLLNFCQSSSLASWERGSIPRRSSSPLNWRNKQMSLGARVHQSLCIQPRFDPSNTWTRWSSVTSLRASRALREIL